MKRTPGGRSSLLVALVVAALGVVPLGGLAYLVEDRATRAVRNEALLTTMWVTQPRFEVPARAAERA